MDMVLICRDNFGLFGGDECRGGKDITIEEHSCTGASIIIVKVVGFLVSCCLTESWSVVQEYIY